MPALCSRKHGARHEHSRDLGALWSEANVSPLILTLHSLCLPLWPRPCRTSTGPSAEPPSGLPPPLQNLTAEPLPAPCATTTRRSCPSTSSLHAPSSSSSSTSRTSESRRLPSRRPCLHRRGRPSPSSGRSSSTPPAPAWANLTTVKMVSRPSETSSSLRPWLRGSAARSLSSRSRTCGMPTRL